MIVFLEKRWQWQYPGWYPSPQGWVHDEARLLATSRIPEPPPIPSPGTFLQIGLRNVILNFILINYCSKKK